MRSGRRVTESVLGAASNMTRPSRRDQTNIHALTRTEMETTKADRRADGQTRGNILAEGQIDPTTPFKVLTYGAGKKGKLVYSETSLQGDPVGREIRL